MNNWGPLVDTVAGVTLASVFSLIGYVTTSVIRKLTRIEKSVARLAAAYLTLTYRVRRIEDSLGLDPWRESPPDDIS